MSLTSIADQRTPGRPVEVTFAADTGLPSTVQEVLLIGKKDATSGSVSAYTVSTISNSGDLTAASGEAITKFGAGSQLAKMVVAAVQANVGRSSYPTLKCIPLASTDSDFGSSDDALTAAQGVKAEFVVSPFDGSDETLTGKLKTHCTLVSGAQRVENNQFGTIGVVFNRSITDTDNLPTYDSQYIMGAWMPDSGTPDYSVAEMAAAVAARVAGNPSPFNPLDDDTLVGVDAPETESEWITVGAGLESESALGKGWTPLRVLANGSVAFVRTITTRLSADGSGTPVLTSYYDVQDFQVLYYFRKAVYTRFAQSDLKQTKASVAVAQNVKSEAIRIATEFENQGMFQAVRKLAKSFSVERSSTDRHRFDVFIPVNVVPGLHVIATNIQAGVEFDTFSL